jgi:hypothetical protein
MVNDIFKNWISRLRDSRGLTISSAAEIREGFNGRTAYSRDPRYHMRRISKMS